MISRPGASLWAMRNASLSGMPPSAFWMTSAQPACGAGRGEAPGFRQGGVHRQRQAGGGVHPQAGRGAGPPHGGGAGDHPEARSQSTRILSERSRAPARPWRRRSAAPLSSAMPHGATWTRRSGRRRTLSAPPLSAISGVHSRFSAIDAPARPGDASPEAETPASEPAAEAGRGAAWTQRRISCLRSKSFPRIRPLCRPELKKGSVFSCCCILSQKERKKEHIRS